MVEKIAHSLRTTVPFVRDALGKCQKLSTRSERSACAACFSQGLLRPFPPGAGTDRPQKELADTDSINLPIWLTGVKSNARKWSSQRPCGDLRTGVSPWLDKRSKSVCEKRSCCGMGILPMRCRIAQARRIFLFPRVPASVQSTGRMPVPLFTHVLRNLNSSLPIIPFFPPEFPGKIRSDCASSSVELSGKNEPPSSSEGP
jgi:hypothetical protein